MADAPSKIILALTTEGAEAAKRMLKFTTSRYVDLIVKVFDKHLRNLIEEDVVSLRSSTRRYRSRIRSRGRDLSRDRDRLLGETDVDYDTE